MPVLSQDLDFNRHLMVFFVFNYFSWQVIVSFVDIGWIVDHHCLNFLFITNLEWKICQQNCIQSGFSIALFFSVCKKCCFWQSIHEYKIKLKPWQCMHIMQFLWGQNNDKCYWKMYLFLTSRYALRLCLLAFLWWLVSSNSAHFQTLMNRF